MTSPGSALAAPVVSLTRICESHAHFRSPVNRAVSRAVFHWFARIIVTMSGDAPNAKKVPAFIGEGHYEAYEFIMKNIEKQKLPKQGNTIVRLDAHLDEIIPRDRIIKAVVEQRYEKKLGMFHDFGTENLLKKLYVAGAIDRVVWVKPPWSKQVLDEQNIQCESRPDKAELSLDIMTLGKTLFGAGDEPDDYDKFKSLIHQRLTDKDSYILDIHFNFLSSDSPFARYYVDIPYHSFLEDIFGLRLPEDQSDPDALQRAQDARTAQLDELQQIFLHLEEHREMPPVENPSEHYQKVEKLRDTLLEKYKDDAINWKIMWDYGVVCGPYHIPYHVNSRDDVLKMIEECLVKILDSLPGPPALITMARTAEYDCYVPNKDCNFIERNVLKLLKQKFNLDQPEMPYLDM